MRKQRVTSLTDALCQQRQLTAFANNHAVKKRSSALFLAVGKAFPCNIPHSSCSDMLHDPWVCNRQALNSCSEKQPGNHLNAKQVAENAGLITLISTDHLRRGRVFHCRIDLIYSSNGWAIRKGRKLKTKLLLFCFLVLQTTAEKVFAPDNSHSLHWPKPCWSLWEHFHWPQQALGHPSPSLEVTHLQCAMYSPGPRGICCTAILLLSRLRAPFSTRRVWEDWNVYYLLSSGVSPGSLMCCVWSTGNAARSPKPGMGSWGHLTEMLRNK